MENRGYIKDFIEKMKKIEENLLLFLDKEGNDESELTKLIQILDDQKIRENKYDLKAMLHLISRISDNYHRTRPFFGKIERILKNFESNIKNFFTNFEIFNIFKKNKRILLFLFEEKILIPDDSIAHIITSVKYRRYFYPQYFYNEFKTFYSEKLLKEINTKSPEVLKDDFDQKRKIGENDQHICELIQNDMITEFTDYCIQNELSLVAEIKPSLFETNRFLLKKKLILIEYCAFYGSIQIFNYLYNNNVKLTPTLWLCVIHSNNSDLVRLLEEKKVEPPSGTFQHVLKETIKCHNVNIMNYVRANLFRNEKPDLNNSYFCQGLKYFNFIEFSERVDEDQLENFLRFCHNDYKTEKAQTNIFYDFCKFDYISIVEYILKNHKSIINPENIQNFSFLNIVFI
ncbi:hypothetical protein M9Y10_019597 [Tritrichomonas musculus]|uniref:DUF3447 domain-containing protein n=1 Tax=Tritrichomonas musculus TaxID=1915356 RepID=A0ABR2HIV0_9EUKA